MREAAGLRNRGEEKSVFVYMTTCEGGRTDEVKEKLKDRGRGG